MLIIHGLFGFDVLGGLSKARKTLLMHLVRPIKIFDQWPELKVAQTGSLDLIFQFFRTTNHFSPPFDSKYRRQL